MGAETESRAATLATARAMTMRWIWLVGRAGGGAVLVPARRLRISAIETGDGTVTRDQGIRTGTSGERMAALRPAFKEDGVITAGNSSQISDGAAALMVMTSRKAANSGSPRLPSCTRSPHAASTRCSC
jgi:Thiolase, N-terminal domain